MKPIKKEASNFTKTGTIKYTKEFTSQQKKSIANCIKAIKGLSVKDSETVLFEVMNHSKYNSINT